MKAVIHKHYLDLSFEPQIVLLPSDGKILTVQNQQDEIVLWEQHDPGREAISRWFIVRPTGQVFDDSWSAYVGTFQLAEFVGHVFEIERPQK